MPQKCYFNSRLTIHLTHHLKLALSRLLFISVLKAPLYQIQENFAVEFSIKRVLV